MNQPRYKRWIAFFLAVLIAVGVPFTPQVLASDDSGSEISIASEKDWADFIKNCKLDSWSKGKRVVLDADLNLSGKFRPVPIFCGSFDGNGHSIHIGTYNSSASDMGVFRYLTAGAEVKNLLVTGTWTVSGSKNAVGGIVGNNSGTISASTFRGVVEGRNNIGGIAGINEETGVIADCTVLGKIEGEHYAGGIAGQNLGTIRKSRNESHVNTEGESVKTTLDEIDMSNINSTENVSAYTDIGGITGFSSGLLEDCENIGTIGYSRIGYNVGGIAGRQSGQIRRCENKGKVYGRKDIGGIVGQMEPYLTLKFGKDDLERLLDAFTGLQNLVDGLLDDTQDTGNAFSARMQSISALTNDARGNADYLIKHTQDYVEESLLIVNDMAKRADGFIYDMNRAMQQSDVLSQEIQDVFSQMHLVTDKMQDAAESGGEIFKHTKESIDILEPALDSYLDIIGNIKNSAKSVVEKAKNTAESLKHAAGSIQKPELPIPPSKPPEGGGDVPDGNGDNGGNVPEKPDLPPDGGNVPEKPDLPPDGGLIPHKPIIPDTEKQNVQVAIQELNNALKTLKNAIKSWQSEGGELRDAMKDAKREVEKALNSGSDMAEELGASLSRLDNAISEMEDVERKAADITDRLQDAVTSFQAGGTPQFPVPGAKYRENSDELLDRTGEILDEVDGLVDDMDAKGDILIDDLRAMNRQMGTIIDIMRDIYKSVLDEDDNKKRYEDVSETENTSPEGVVEQCQNYGIVEGDIAVGGISGAIGVEYDFDPEDDLEKQGKRSLQMHYQTKAILRDSTNYGAITGKKDYIGGIVGYMKTGSLSQCEAYGKVISENGDYVGGIAGQSDSVIRKSAAKVILEGGKYIGGIAGQGNDIFKCGAMVEIENADEGIGAVAGHTEGEFSENYFVECKWGGIDDISYAGKAEPMAYEDFIQLEGLPKRFRSFYLTFIADGKILADLAYPYGADVNSQEIPKVPAKKGYSGKWENLPNTVTFDRVLEAVYTQNNSSIASEEKREDGVKAVMLAEGSFAVDDVITLTPLSEKEAEPIANGTFVEGWKVKLPDDGREEHLIRYCMPKGKGKANLYKLSADGAEKLSVNKDGQYLCFTMKENEFTIYSTRSSNAGLALLISCGIAAAAAVLVHTKRRKIKKFVRESKEQ